MRQLLFIFTFAFFFPTHILAQKKVLMSDIPNLIASDPAVPLLLDIQPALQPKSFNDSPIDVLNIRYQCTHHEYKKLEYNLTEYYDDIYEMLCQWRTYEEETENLFLQLVRQMNLLDRQYSTLNRSFCRAELSEAIEQSKAQGYKCFNTLLLVGFEGRGRLVKIIDSED